MKKKLMIIAIAAISACAFMACTDNGQNGGEATDATQTEQTEEPAQEPQEVKIEDLTQLESDLYLINIPEGCKAGSRVVNNSCNLRFSGEPFTTVAVSNAIKNLDEIKADFQKNGAKALDDIIVDGKTFNVFSAKNKDGRTELTALATNDAGKVIALKAFNGANKMDEAKADEILLNNLKKLVEATKVK